MNAVVDYFFSPNCGEAYLCHDLAMSLAADCGAKLRLWPMDLYVVHDTATGRRPSTDDEITPEAITNRLIRARQSGLRMSPVPMHHPTDPRMACRLLLAAGRMGLDEGPLALALLRGTWAEGLNIGDPGDLADALRQMDLPALELLRLADSDRLRDAEDDITAKAVEAGVRFSPTAVVGGERYEGDEGLQRLRRKLMRAAA
ncbi:hypothetical protein GCM10011415_24100 [Salipiger pallidus]|uniref:DSBA-like thioredoxin domain-containing protein n=1 Tax=Salipiger pallidus TaxID=1775170 RepID=A0A8J2ZK98_9RHOB|nr:DsbA family protein [Salipiger pallidus]GGG74776.1 hypothetical protein GCM10011415_24100 [Salipiger pallidus]